MNHELNEEIQKLIEQFRIITRKGWLKSVNKGLVSIGYTFEKALDKIPDSLYLPDYYGTEIKCTSRYSRYPITLFTVAFDGPTFPEINRLIDRYGYFDEEYSDKKILIENLWCMKKTEISSGFKFQLDIDKKQEKIFLAVYNLDDELIERESFIYFKTIYDHLMLKLNRLALIFASKKVIKEEIHFRYYKMNIYNIRSFETFLELLNCGIVQVSLIARVSRSGTDAGRYRNKNLVFKIKKDKVDSLFQEIYSYNHDEDSNVLNNFTFFDKDFKK